MPTMIIGTMRVSGVVDVGAAEGSGTEVVVAVGIAAAGVSLASSVGVVVAVAGVVVVVPKRNMRKKLSGVCPGAPVLESC